MQTERRFSPYRAAETFIILSCLWLCAELIRAWLPNATLVIPMARLASAFVLLTWAFPAQTRQAAAFCFRYRWALALLVFCVCVCLRLHGSSIGIYDEVFPTQIEAQESTLFGAPRPIRSDEYGVTTLKFFSQAANGYRLYSQQMSLSPTNMVLDYYSPVWDWTILGKPFAWGFLLFGNEVGLSWYWCMEIILLFMTALEMCLILTDGRRLESLLGGVLVALSPEIQWWVIPQLPLALLYAMALFCACYWFFTARSLASKLTSALVLPMAGIGAVLSVLPSVQIPALYGNIALLIVCLRRDRDRFSFSKKDLPRLFFSLALICAVLGGFALKSVGDFPRATNTVYPGRRVSTGGWWTGSALFTDLTSLFLPYVDANYLNNCEVSCFVHFAPFFLILTPRMMPYLRQKGDRNASVGKALMWILAAEIVYLAAGIPEFLANMTFLRFCNRMDSVYDWTATLFTVWGFSVLLRYPDMLTFKEKILCALGYGAVALLAINHDTIYYFLSIVDGDVSLVRPLLGGTLFLMDILLLLLMCRKKRLFSALLILLMVFCGATVNPVERGVGAITNHPLSAAVSEIAAAEPDSRWLFEGEQFYLSNYLMANGAKVMDATCPYPDPEKWSILDPEGIYDNVTNRYANQRAVLTDGESSIELIQADYIWLYLNPQDLKDLQIRYLCTRTDHSELLAKYGVACEYVTGQDGLAVYRLDY